MPASFWIRRFVLVFAGAFAIIGGAQFLKGHTLRYSISQALLWGAISTSIYIFAAQRQLRKRQSCAICPVPPETQGATPASDPLK